VLIMWENFGAKLSSYLKWENLSGVILNMLVYVCARAHVLVCACMLACINLSIIRCKCD